MSTSGKGKRVAVFLAAVVAVGVPIVVCLSWPQIVARYRFWRRFESLGLNDRGFPEYRHRMTGIIMLRLPGGTFWMGTQSQDPKGRNYDPQAEWNEGPVHEITLSPFLLAKYEVTRDQWKRVMGSSASGVQGDEPVLKGVSWADIQEFEARTGLTLPTEAQWEYASRAGRTSAHRSGGDRQSLGEYRWYGEDSGNSAHRVSQRSPNNFGLFDMHAGAWEWCEDVYNEAFYSTPHAVRRDPVCTSGSGYRVVRDRRWSGLAGSYRSAYRGRIPPGVRYKNLGFRAAYWPLP